MKMYLQKVIPKAKKLRKKRFFVAVLKVTDEYSRIRIHSKMSWIRYHWPQQHWIPSTAKKLNNLKIQ
jgi:hypothetical protein